MGGRISISVQASWLKYILFTFGHVYSFCFGDFSLMLMVNQARMLFEQLSIELPTATASLFLFWVQFLNAFT